MSIHPIFEELLKPWFPQRFITCSACGQPCGIVHDLDMSDCCAAPIAQEKGGETNGEKP